MKTVLINILQKTSSHKEKRVRDLLSVSGLNGIFCKRVSAVYRFRGSFTSAELEKIGKELLADPVIEHFYLGLSPADARTLFADVWYKPGVTDTVGENVLKALQNLGVTSVTGVSAGTRYEFYSKKSRKNSKKIVSFIKNQLLNPLVQECSVK